MKSCLHCSEKNRDQANFCGNCGNSFSTPAAEITPAKSKTSRSSVRCHECGKPTVDVVRRNVKTGSSSGKGGSRFYYHRVNLCEECAETHDTKRFFFAIVVVIFLLVYACNEGFKQ